MLYNNLIRGIKGLVKQCNLLNSTLFKNYSDVPNLLSVLNKAEIENNGVGLKLHHVTRPERVIQHKNKLHSIKRA